ncbi:MAG TPA: response regulator, partial [Steroidobacteraceae bacterium]|nr:response regulator [Steroidobacteraceae bacterium]
LGLAISRELSKLLGGEIRLSSAPGKGSVFTLYLPHTYAPRASRPRASQSDITAQAVEPIRARVAALQEALRPPVVTDTPAELAVEVEPERPINEAQDDREIIHAGDRVLLIVENDLAFARFLLDAAREKGFKGLVTSLGTGALSLACEFKPTAITLDIFLPDMDGWRVMSRLKHDLATRHVPICVISTDESRERALGAGAFAFVAKPIQSKEVLEEALDDIQGFVGREARHLLLLMPQSEERDALIDELAGDDVRVFPVESADTALKVLREQPVDCMVIDAAAPGMEPSDVAAALEHRSQLGRLPLIFGGDAAQEHRERFGHRLREQVTACAVHSRARLLDQAAFFLHRPVGRIAAAGQSELRELYESNKVLAGRKVLIVDDDMRNIFALATVLDEQGMKIISADNGREAIHHVATDPAIDIVLMDIMMPEMDGMTTIREIRKTPGRRDLPIVAVTAKAMKGDREKCIEAGAWDYLSKPVDTQDLLAAMRAWLKR